MNDCHPAGTLQFCVVKPLMTISIVAMNIAGVYQDGNLSLGYGRDVCTWTVGAHRTAQAISMSR